MHGPVVLDQEDLLGVRIGVLNGLVEPQQGVAIKVRPLPGQQLPGLRIQTARDAPHGIAAHALARQQMGRLGKDRIAGCDTRPAVVVSSSWNRRTMRCGSARLYQVMVARRCTLAA